MIETLVIHTYRNVTCMKYAAILVSPVFTFIQVIEQPVQYLSKNHQEWKRFIKIFQSSECHFQIKTPNLGTESLLQPHNRWNVKSHSNWCTFAVEQVRSPPACPPNIMIQKITEVLSELISTAGQVHDFWCWSQVQDQQREGGWHKAIVGL